MDRKRLQLVAAAALVVVACAVVYLTVGNTKDSKHAKHSPKQVAITCVGGSEKSELMADPQIQQILRETYGLTVTFKPLGSYDQVQMTAADLTREGVDCLWPSSASAQAVFESLHPNPSAMFPGYRSATVLQSPEVIYAGPNGTAALIKSGVVQQRGNQYYIVDLKKLLLDYVLKDTTWDQLGAKDLSGPVKIASTDPAKSNSGFTLTQLELTILSATNVYSAPSEAQAHKALTTIRALYDAQGLQATSSDFGFEQWLLHGAELGAPLYAGYENQLIQQEVKLSGDQGALRQLTDQVRVLYPEPTLYNDHPILALDAKAAKLIDALRDPAVQQIAWKNYGFRSGTTVGINQVSDFKDLNLAQQLRTTVAPNAAVTQLLLKCLKQGQCS